jgi:hypothetical protein
VPLPDSPRARQGRESKAPSLQGSRGRDTRRPHERDGLPSKSQSRNSSFSQRSAVQLGEAAVAVGSACRRRGTSQESRRVVQSERARESQAISAPCPGALQASTRRVV